MKECFTGASFKQEILKNINDDFKNEREKEMLDFFKDKAAIQKKMRNDFDKTLQKVKSQSRSIMDRPKTKANLKNYTDLTSTSYVKYTFLDFGKGYTKTLRKEFIARRESLKGLVSPGFETACEDAQIIEFAYRLESSSNTIDENMEHYKFVPRGLYFVVDMARRYKGLLKIRSGTGKVFYDFSDQIYVEVNDERPSITIHNSNDVRDAVVHIQGEEPPFFEGTLITLLLPAKEQSRAAIGDERIITPVRADSDVLNDYIYYRKSDPLRRNAFNLEEFLSPSYEMISVAFVFHKAIKRYNEASKQEDEKAPSAQQSAKTFYNYSFSALTSEISKFEGRNCVIFLDFEGLHYTTQILKIIYYLLETPKVNELTKVVIVNLDEVSDSIVTKINTKMASESEGPKLYKAIPCLSFPDKFAAPSVKWIGLKNDADEAILTKILLNLDMPFRERQVNSLVTRENVEGNMFVEVENQIFSFF